MVRTPHGFAALNSHDLSPAWSWPTKESAAMTENERYRITRAILGSGVPATSVFEEAQFVAETVTLAHDLALLATLDEVSDSRTAGRIPVNAQQFQPGQRPSPDNPEFTRPAATRLIACDARTGELRWIRFVGLDEESGELPVEIRGRPIDVNGHLWVPALRQNQLLFAVVDPRTGRTIREVDLCAVDLGLRSYRTAIYPVFRDGIVYLSTDEGMILSVDAASFSIRWAASYQRGSSGEFGQWLPSPPTVTGGLVLVAPNDCDDLMAFSTIDGQFRWSVRTKELRLFLGADRNRAWYVGQDVRCVSTKDGHEEWASVLPKSLTGQPAMRDGHIYVPTVDTLVTISARTGAIENSQSLPPAAGSLGNLLVSKMGVYAFDPLSVRFFPDMDRSYANTVARYDSDRGNLPLAVHLSRLEILKGLPDRALTLLDSINLNEPIIAHSANATSQKDRISNAKTEALLAMASRPESDKSKITDWLRRAVNESATFVKRFQATLALAARLESTGQYSDAYHTLWQIGTMSDRVPLLAGEDGARLAHSVELSKHCQRIRSLLSPAELNALDADTLQQVSALQAKLSDDEHRQQALRALNAIVDLQCESPACYEAQLVLAEWEWSRNQWERADLRLRTLVNAKNLRRPSPEQINRMRNLDHQRLAEDFQHAPSSPGMANPRESSAADTNLNWAESSKSRPIQVLGDRVLGDVMLDDTGNERKKLPNGRLADAKRRLVTIEPDDDGSHNDYVIVMESEETVEAVNPRTLDIYWSAPLRLPSEFRPVTPRVQIASDPKRYRATVDGKIGVFQTRKGFFAVGLRTGKRLWAIESDGSTAAEQVMASFDGMTALSPRSGIIQVVKTLDGSTVWERDLSSDPIKKIWIHANTVVTADATLERIQLFSLTDGRLIRQVQFRQADPRSRLTRLVLSDGILCGPDSTQQSGAVFAVDLADGRNLWRTELSKPVSQLFEPEPGEVGIGTMGGDVRIVKLCTGKLEWDYHIPDANTVFDGTKLNNVLVLEHSAPPSPLSRHWTAVFPGSNETLWRRSDLAPMGRWNERIKIVDSKLATVLEVPDSRAQAVRLLRLALIDPITGQDVGPQVDLHGGRAANTPLALTGDWGFWSDLVVVGSHDGLILVSTAPEGTKEGSDSK
ncbi:MAG: PQQ-binding-like beta-propeller repeat protein [Planctomycetota bacterium]